jgi:hypothetical protein
MTPRERNLVVGILALILFGGGAFGAYTFVFSPLEDTNAAIKQLQDEIDGTKDKPGLDSRVEAMRKAPPFVAVAKRQSLPPNIDLARTQYKLLLERILQQSKIYDYKIPNATTIIGKPPVTPELAAKKPAYTTLQFHLDIHKVDIWQLADFLYVFYELDLLHQITDLTITRQNKATEMRNHLDVTLTIEAIILDGAEQRSSLFPIALIKLTEESIATLKKDNVPDLVISKLNPLKSKQLPQEDFLKEASRLLTQSELRQYQNTVLRNVTYIGTPSGGAVTAIGGGLAFETVAAQPELARKVTAISSTPVLATRHRDYSLLALSDIFYGILPVDKSPAGLTIAKIADMQVSPGEKIPDVKVRLTGDGAETAKLTATCSGTMLPEGPLNVDPKTNTISFPAINEYASEYAYATISVLATSESGKEQKASFRITFTSDGTRIGKEDIAGAIKLIMVSGTSDGIVTAIIQDSANPFKYKITSSPKNGIGVIKFYRVKAWAWGTEDYNYPAGVLAFSDETSSTKRTFKVLAIEGNSLIVADYGKHDGKADARPEQRGRGGRGPGGGAAPRVGPAEPLAVVAGNLATAIPAPTLYRWTTGMSLKDLDDKEHKAKIPADEARKILQNIAAAEVVEIPVSSAK